SLCQRRKLARRPAAYGSTAGRAQPSRGGRRSRSHYRRLDQAVIYFLIVIALAGIILYAVVESGSGKKRKRSKHAGESREYHGYIDRTDVMARWHAIMATSK